MKATGTYSVPICINEKKEALPLNLVIIDKKITSVTVKYLSKEITVEKNLLKGILKSKVIPAGIKELTITDKDGLKMNFDVKNEQVMLRTNSYEEYIKLKDCEFNETTIIKLYQMSFSHPFYFFFNIANLVKVDWQ